MKQHLGTLAIIIAAAAVLSAQVPGQLPGVRYYSGQNVAPVFEGWEKNPDGTFSFVFGYLNRNYEEQPEIPVGAENMFSPGPADRGQPTHFYPRRQQFMFKVNVPADFGSKELTWTLKRDGKTESAVAHLALEWELTEIVYSQNRGGLARDSVTALPNKGPSVTIDGTAKLTATVGAPLALTATANDDGIPKPSGRGGGGAAGAGRAGGAAGAGRGGGAAGAGRGAAGGAAAGAAPDGAAPPPTPQRGDAAGRGGRGGTQQGPALSTVKSSPIQQAVVRPATTGLAVTWLHWRGPGTVTFTPTMMVAKEGKVSTEAKFSQPGTYVLRAFADDGVLLSTADVTVVVK
jgi:hypothetical protein